ncbi:MAG: DNA polymerase III subunit beta [Patescibacteria group bacterium]
MKITILQENLKNSLNHLQKTIPTKPQLPILSSILLEAKKNRLFLSATDLYFGIRTEIDIKVDEEGVIVVPGDTFRSLINSLSQEEIKISHTQQNILIQTNKNKVSLPLQNPEEYPPFPEISGTVLNLSLEDLERIIKLVSFTASLDQTRPVLTTILFKFSKDSLEVVATDGYRLSRLMIDKEFEEELEMMVPAKALQEIYRVATQLNSKTVSIQVSQELKQALFCIDQTNFYVRLIDGEYPPYQKIVPDSFLFECEFEVEDLMQQLKRAMIFCRDSSNIIRLQIDAEKILIKSSSPVAGNFEGEVSLNKSNFQGEQQIAFNANYLHDFLNNIKDGIIWFSMNESLKPAMFKTMKQDDYFHVVMPFRVNE